MNQEEVENILIKAVCDIQSMSGRPLAALTGTSNIFAACAGFDSLNAVEVTVEVSRQLNLPLSVQNNFFTDGNKILTVAQSAARICAALKISN